MNDPELQQLPREVEEELALATHSSRKIGTIMAFDFGSAVGSYANVIERWLWVALRDWTLKDTKMLQALRNSRDYRPLSEDVAMLWSLRCEGGAHPGLKRSRSDAETARSLALSILRQGENIRLRPKAHSTMEV